MNFQAIRNVEQIREEKNLRCCSDVGGHDYAMVELGIRMGKEYRKSNGFTSGTTYFMCRTTVK